MMANEALPRAFGAPKATGAMKRRPCDFRVSEVLGEQPAGSGEHVYLRVRKTGANTAWVAERLAQFAGLHPREVSYSGRKDRHAVTEQWFSLHLPGRADPDWRNFSAEGVEILASCRHTKKLRRGTHEANAFSIRITDVMTSGDLTPTIREISSKGFPNYFGPQRFGRDGGNLVRAEKLLSGQMSARARDRDLWLSAARSHLFNLALAARVMDGTWCEPGAFGWLPGQSRKALHLERIAGYEHWYEALERFGVKAMRRPLAIVPGDFRVAQEDTDLILEFRLEAGSYATSLVRELVRTDVDVGGADSEAVHGKNS